MLQEYPFLDRFKVAADAGFSGVDIQFPYDVSPGRLAKEVQSAGVEVVLFNLPAGDLIKGGLGLASHPERKQEFREGVQRALSYAEVMGNKRVNVLAGKIDGTRKIQDHTSTLMENMEYAAKIFEPLGVTVMVEPVNGFDVPDYLLQTVDSAASVIEKVESENIKLQFDIYHQYRMERNVVAMLEKYHSLIGHIQFADMPGRHEPGTGNINFVEIFKKIDEVGYVGWIGAEYHPSVHTLETLSWFQSNPPLSTQK